MRKKVLLYILVVTIVLNIAPKVMAEERTGISLTYDGGVHYYDEEAVQLYVNGLHVTAFGGDMPPIILYDRVYLPVRDIFEMLGASVAWNDSTSQVHISYGGKLVALRGDSPYINVDGELIQISVPPKNINGRMMAPVSIIAGIFGFEVDWYGETRTVTVDSGEPLPQPTNPPENTGSTLMPEETPTVRHDEPASTPAAITTAIDTNVGTGPVALERAIDADPGSLPAESHPKTNIVAIEYDEKNPHVFYIRADSPISKVDKFVLSDNRLILDFYNAEKKIEETEFYVGSSILSRVRIGQNQVTPEMITRVVFDLNEPVSFNVNFSEDRQTIIVSFLRNEITDVQFVSDGYADYVYIFGRITPVVNIFPQSVDGAFIIDISLGIVGSASSTPVNGVFAGNLRVEQYTSASARVVLDMKDKATYSVTYDGNCTIVKLTRPTYQNIRYDSFTSRLIIPKTAGLSIDISRIAHSDEYLNYRYTLVLPGDYSAYLGEGDYIVKDNYVNFISISTANNRTSIRFHEQRVMAFEVTEDEWNIYVNVMLPKDKYARIVVIDPGHGGKDAGTEDNGLKEKELNLDISIRLVKLLENAGIKTYMTRTSDTYPTREERAEFANDVGDIFVSIHNNSWNTSDPYGTEVYYYTHYNDDFIGFTSKRAAEIMLKNIISTLGSHSRDYKEFEYRVLVLTEIPAVLCEFGFITNRSDAAKLKTDEYRQKCADGAFKGILEIFGEYTPKR